PCDRPTRGRIQDSPLRRPTVIIYPARAVGARLRRWSPRVPEGQRVPLTARFPAPCRLHPGRGRGLTRLRTAWCTTRNSVPRQRRVARECLARGCVPPPPRGFGPHAGWLRGGA